MKTPPRSKSSHRSRGRKAGYWAKNVLNHAGVACESIPRVVADAVTPVEPMQYGCPCCFRPVDARGRQTEQGSALLFKCEPCCQWWRLENGKLVEHVP